MPPKIYVQKPSFQTLKIKKRQENTKHKKHRRSYGRSTITQRPILASTPPKLRTIWEESSDASSSDTSSSRSSKKSAKERSPIEISRHNSPRHLLDEIKSHGHSHLSSTQKKYQKKTSPKNSGIIAQTIRNTTSAIKKFFSRNKTSKIR